MKAIAMSIPQFVTEDGIQGVKNTYNKGNKLFAVTQDIGIGDDVQDIIGNKGSSLSDDGLIIYWTETKETTTISTKTKPTYFKVLGELSPQATFVKDGDEIEVFPKPFARYGDDKKWYKPMGGLPPKEEKSFMGVKCPTCNTYN